MEELLEILQELHPDVDFELCDTRSEERRVGKEC